jgi:hypothetical protein
MRSALALGLLITLCASANTETVHHVRTRHHVTIQPSQGRCVPSELLQVSRLSALTSGGD